MERIQHDTSKRIFISYVHEDEDVAAGIAAWLRDNGYNDVFFTGNNWLLYAGEVWLDRIREELTEAAVVLSLFSPASIERQWIHFEAGAAWLTGKALIPVCIKGFTAPDLRIPYAGIQAVTLQGYSSAYYLLRSIHKHLSGGLPSPPFNPETDCWRTLEAALQSKIEEGAK